MVRDPIQPEREICFSPLIFLAQSSKGIDSVTIKDPKLVEFIASLLEVQSRID